MASKKRKYRAEFRKHHQGQTRRKDLTQRFATDSSANDEASGERVSGKGELTRRRTLAGGEVIEDESGQIILPEVDRTICKLGRVLRVQGLVSIVSDATGREYSCATRRLLKSLQTDLRHIVAAGDRVWFRPEGEFEGIIERVEPRRGVLSRTSKGRQHVIVANVDQMILVASAAEPRVKPNLIDRYLVTAEKSRIRPVICINKVDLIDPADLLPLSGVYAQLGYRIVLASATTGQGVEQLKSLLADQETVLTGQSGVGKSSLLNAIEPGLALRVQSVSAESQKGRHTTTTTQLLPLSQGGWVVDTPGIRQFQLWDVIPEEVGGYFRDIRPYVSFCRFPDCTHTHEDYCAVKDAVADGWIDTRRYESYVQIRCEN